MPVFSLPQSGEGSEEGGDRKLRVREKGESEREGREVEREREEGRVRGRRGERENPAKTNRKPASSAGSKAFFLIHTLSGCFCTFL